jgi:hypothetical protein
LLAWGNTWANFNFVRKQSIFGVGLKFQAKYKKGIWKLANVKHVKTTWWRRYFLDNSTENYIDIDMDSDGVPVLVGFGVESINLDPYISTNVNRTISKLIGPEALEKLQSAEHGRSDYSFSRCKTEISDIVQNVEYIMRNLEYMR